MIPNPYIFVKVNNQKRDLEEVEIRSQGKIMWSSERLPTQALFNDIAFLVFCNVSYDDIELEELFKHMKCLCHTNIKVLDDYISLATEMYQSVDDFLDKYFCNVDDDLASVSECEVFDLL